MLCVSWRECERRDWPWRTGGDKLGERKGCRGGLNALTSRSQLSLDRLQTETKTSLRDEFAPFQKRERKDREREPAERSGEIGWSGE